MLLIGLPVSSRLLLVVKFLMNQKLYVDFGPWMGLGHLTPMLFKSQPYSEGGRGKKNGLNCVQ